MLKAIENKTHAVYRQHLTSLYLAPIGEMVYPCSPQISRAILATKYEKEQELLDAINGRKGRLFFWSDQHFGHQNIIKYCDRPFENKQEMAQVLFDRYCEKVGDEDVVVFGGDFMMADKDQSRAFLEKMPGLKVCVVGNHDFSTKKENVSFLFEKHHFDFVTDSLLFEDSDGMYLVSHYPVRSVLLPDNVKNIHGHIHDIKIRGDRHLSMCCEVLDYVPQELSSLKAVNTAYKTTKEMDF